MSQSQQVAALIFVVEGEVGILLKDADFSHPLLADPAGGDIGHAAVLKSKAHIGDILAAAEHGDANSIQSRKRGAHEM